MARRLFILATLLACIAILSIWPRTLRISDVLERITRAHTQYWIETHPGGLDFRGITHFDFMPPEFDPISANEPSPPGWYYATHLWGPDSVPVAATAPPIAPSSAAALAGRLPNGEVVVFSRESMPVTRDAPSHNVLGMGFESKANSWTATSGVPITQKLVRVSIPLWLPAVLLSLPAVLTLRRALVRRNRRRNNRCLSCGYDLRGSSDRCPECGLATAPTLTESNQIETREVDAQTKVSNSSE